MLPPASSTTSNAAAASAPGNQATLVNGRLSAPGVGVWTEEEHKRFRTGVETYPNGPWSAVAEFVGTRNVRQTMTHAQKCRQRLERHARGLKPAGRKRRASQSDNSIAASPASPATSLSGTFEILTVAELPLAGDAMQEPIDPTNFDWVIPYLSSPDWVDLEVLDDDLFADGQSLELIDLGP